MSKKADEAAKRVFDNLTQMIRFDYREKTAQNSRNSPDSGIGDESLDSWRLKASNAVCCFSKIFLINSKIFFLKKLYLLSAQL